MDSRDALNMVDELQAISNYLLSQQIELCSKRDDLNNQIDEIKVKREKIKDMVMKLRKDAKTNE